MATPGIADPYWYEWFVGLENLIKMLNPDNGIDYVVFQHSFYDTIDDVVVGYNNGNQEICYQVKHVQSTESRNNLTFDKLIKKEGDKKPLISAMALGWKNAINNGDHILTPILYTNRNAGLRTTKRTFNGTTYNAYPVVEFFSLIKKHLSSVDDINDLTFDDENLKYQWEEIVGVIGLDDLSCTIEFIKAFEMRANQSDLADYERKLIQDMQNAFSCSDSIALELFNKLVAALRKWTVTFRENEKVTIEDVYSVLGTESEIDESQHRLAPPYPFFESRKEFCNHLKEKLTSTDKKIVFISGEPGSGKTSIISYLQAEANLFLLRYHTFKPISPEQHFYNLDEGLCASENLWGTLLSQLRRGFKGKLVKYKVPITNDFCSTEAKRDQVKRLLGILGDLALQERKKVLVCIDGIDHAARSQCNVSFLDSLFLPEEIPDGVCFVIVGQPTDMYERYPDWLKTGTGVDKVEMPKLQTKDIQQLILDQVPQLESEIEAISTAVFEKTQGNNLSSVFAVEELKHLQSIEEVFEHIRNSAISSDIQQYYKHLWNFVKEELRKIGITSLYPESLVACPLLLMNGRVNPNFLANALSCNISESEWKDILKNLFPLIVPCADSDDFALYHNDFRVYLMGTVRKYQEKYKDIAFQLASYVLDGENCTLKYIRGIPLLCSAERKELIPKYFTPEFVIEALAEGVSKVRLAEFVQLSYEEACSARNEQYFLNTYLAIKTLHQHENYFEYYDRKYVSNDHPELENIDISEIRRLPLSKCNLNEYSRVLSLCVNLYSCADTQKQSRALSLYHRWFSKLTPSSFVKLCMQDIDEEKLWEIKNHEVGRFIETWGKAASLLKVEVINEKSLSDLERTANFILGDSYFNAAFDNGDYKTALNSLKRGCVSRTVFDSKIEMMIYNNVVDLFADLLCSVARDNKKQLPMLLANVALSLANYEDAVSIDVLRNIKSIDRIYDNETFQVVLASFVIGSVEYLSDEIIVCSHAKVLYNGIKAEEREKKQISKLVRLACLLGKYHKDSTEEPSDALKQHMRWFLTESMYRYPDYVKAYRFLLFVILNNNKSDVIAVNSDLISWLEVSLFEIRSLGMYYKTDILDFLMRHDRLDVIKNYIEQLYGEDGSSIALEEQFAEMHKKFSMYGELVLPELMKKVSAGIKWDVVGYMGYKEYIMDGVTKCYEALSELSPSVWRDCGEQLYRQSLIAENSSNKCASEIQESIIKSAIKSGLSDYWELHYWDEDFKMNPYLLYKTFLELIDNAKSIEDLISVWMMNLGIHSWYTQDDRLSSKAIFTHCIKKAEELKVDFESAISKITPQWLKIVQHESEPEYKRTDDSYYIKREQEYQKLYMHYHEIIIEKLGNELLTLNESSNTAECFAIIVNRLQAENLLNEKSIQQIYASARSILRDKQWEFNGFDNIIQKLLQVFGVNAFWFMADIIGENLHEYRYQTAMRNIQLLLNAEKNTNLESCKILFDAELSIQRAWKTGNGHIVLNDQFEHMQCNFPTPRSYLHLAVFVLTEQLETFNARKIESSIYAIYKIGVFYPEVIKLIAGNWDAFSESQIQYLLLVISRWGIQRLDGFEELYAVLIGAYKKCNSLSLQYMLQSVLCQYSPEDPQINDLCYNSNAAGYKLSVEGERIIDTDIERFLQYSEYVNGQRKMNDDIRRSIKKTVVHNDGYGEIGDFYIPAYESEANQILYGEDKKGRWSDIPIGMKKCMLLPIDDPFLVTDVPEVVYDETWFPSSVFQHDSHNKNLNINDIDVSKFVDLHCGANEKVLAVCAWLPWAHDEGIVYTKVAKAVSRLYPFSYNSEIRHCAGNYGLLFRETDLYQDGVTIRSFEMDLFMKLVGRIKFVYGNCQLVPSNVWKDIFECHPDDVNPYIWRDSSETIVLRFERIASPIKVGIHEKYYRQPVVFRWICNLPWIERKLSENGFVLKNQEYYEELP